MRRMRNPNELFVGDLSFFCTEQHLFDLFSSFGSVVEARIKRSDKGGRTLMYGFVRMESLKAALDATKALNGHMLLGREIRVQLSLTNTYYDKAAKTQTSYPVQVNFSSQFASEKKIVEPNEARLRTLLEPMGELVDIAVRDYAWNKEHDKQEGFAIATFATEDAANRALSEVRECDLSGISVTCVPLLKPVNGSKQLPAKHAHHSSQPPHSTHNPHNAQDKYSVSSLPSESQAQAAHNLSHTISHTGSKDNETMDLQDSFSSLSLSRHYDNAQSFHTPNASNTHSFAHHEFPSHTSHTHTHHTHHHHHTNASRHPTQYTPSHSHHTHISHAHAHAHPHSYAHKSPSHFAHSSHSQPHLSHHALHTHTHTHTGSVNGGETSSESHSSAESLSLWSSRSNSARETLHNNHTLQLQAQRQGQGHAHLTRTHLSPYTLAAHDAHINNLKTRVSHSHHPREFVDANVPHDHHTHSHSSHMPYAHHTHTNVRTAMPFYERDSHRNNFSASHTQHNFSHNSLPPAPERTTTSFNGLFPPPHPHNTHGSHLHMPHTTQRAYTVSAASRVPPLSHTHENTYTHVHAHPSPLPSPHISPRTHFSSYTDTLTEAPSSHIAATQFDELSPRSVHITQPAHAHTSESFFGSLPDCGEPLEAFSLDAHPLSQDASTHNERLSVDSATLSLPHSLWDNQHIFSRNIAPTSMTSPRAHERESLFSFDSVLRDNSNGGVN